MKKLITISLILFKSIVSFAQIDVELKFYDNCKDSIVHLDYELTELTEGGKTFYAKSSKTQVSKLGVYFLSSGIERNNLIATFDYIIEINDSPFYADTLTIPNIAFTWDGVLNSQFWTYTNCGEICNGEKTDYYANGNLRFKGFFDNGKPSEILEYRENGTLLTKEIYEVGTQDYQRIEYFDSGGLLQEYEIHQIKKNKTIIRTYDNNDKLIDKEIRKYTV